MTDRRIRGAGGTDGGIGRFFVGVILFIVGLYLLLNSIRVTSGFSMGLALYSFGSFRINSGMVLVPFIVGVAIIFYNSKSYVGWGLSVGSLACLLFGVITSIRFSMVRMSAFDLIMILVLCFGGLGLFLSSLRDMKAKDLEEQLAIQEVLERRLAHQKPASVDLQISEMIDEAKLLDGE